MKRFSVGYCCLILVFLLVNGVLANAIENDNVLGSKKDGRTTGAQVESSKPGWSGSGYYWGQPGGGWYTGGGSGAPGRAGCGGNGGGPGGGAGGCGGNAESPGGWGGRGGAGGAGGYPWPWGWGSPGQSGSGGPGGYPRGGTSGSPGSNNGCGGNDGAGAGGCNGNGKRPGKGNGGRSSDGGDSGGSPGTAGGSQGGGASNSMPNPNDPRCGNLQMAQISYGYLISYDCGNCNYQYTIDYSGMTTGQGSIICS